MSGGATVVFRMLFLRASKGYPIGIFFSTTLHHEQPEGLRFHVKLDAVYKRHRPDGHVCRTIVEARCSRNGAGAGAARTCLNVPSERSVLASHHED